MIKKKPRLSSPDKELREHKEQIDLLKNVINSCPDFIFVKDTQLRTLVCNNVFAAAVGKKPEAMIGKTDYENGWNPDQIRIFHKDDRRVLRGETLHVPNDIVGDKIFDTIKRPLKTKGGKLIGVLGISRDVTEKKKAEARLVESEKLFQQLTENIQEVFWLSAADGSQVVYVSPAYEEIWGRKRKALYADSRAWMEAIHEEDRPAVEKAFYSLASKGQYNVKFRVVRTDGTIRWVRDRGFPVRDATGKIVRIAGVAQDITALIEVDKAKTEFVSLASHQLRTPLTSIKWILQEALSQTKVLTAWQKSFLGDAYASTERMIRLVNDLLNVSRLETNFLNVESRPARVNAFLASLARELKPTLDGKGQKFILTLPKTPVKASFDAQLLGRW